MKNLLRLKASAQCLEEAFLLGNGSLGATVYGGAATERILMNHDTLWSGYPRDKNHKGSENSLEEIRAMLNRDELQEAATAIQKNLLSDFTESYQPAGELNIFCPALAQNASVERCLFLDNALCETIVKSDALLMRREHFCSFPNNAFLTQISMNKPTEVRLMLTSPFPHVCRASSVLTLLANLPAHVEPSYFSSENPVVYEDNGYRGMAYAMGLSLLEADGPVEITTQGIVLKNCTKAVFVLQIKTGFRGYNTPPLTCTDCLEKELALQLAAIKRFSYDVLRQNHIKDYEALYGTTKISLCRQPEQKGATIDEHLKNVCDDKNAGAMAELMFCYGRYLLISSSREGTQAANLQGIWNSAVRPPWSSNYTLNINTEMNYWNVEATGLHTCHTPILDLAEELAENGAKTAKDVYGMRGWVAHHNTDLWRQTSPIGVRQTNAVPYAFWPFGGVWLCLHLWQMYEYTTDEALLNRAYPIMKGAAQFMLDFLSEDKHGRLTTSPSTSPENTFYFQGKPLAAYQGSTMDLSLLQALFSAVCSGAEILNKDEDFCATVKQAQKMLCGYTIHSDGRLAEWSRAFDEVDPHHRHLSHLVGIYPLQTITEPTLLQAGRKSLEARGNAGTGWSLAWKACLWAALGEGDVSYDFFKRMLTRIDPQVTQAMGGVYPNLLCAHPPFQIDGNFGIAAAITAWLVQSSKQKIILLPALPNPISSGSAEGMKAHGGISVSFQWREKRVVCAEFSAMKDTSFCLLANGEEQLVTLQKGQTRKILWPVLKN